MRFAFALLTALALCAASRAQELQTLQPGPEPCGRDGCPNAVRLVKHDKPAQPMPAACGPVVVKVAAAPVFVTFPHPVLAAMHRAGCVFAFHVHQLRCKAHNLGAAVVQRVESRPRVRHAVFAVRVRVRFR